MSNAIPSKDHKLLLEAYEQESGAFTVKPIHVDPTEFLYNSPEPQHRPISTEETVGVFHSGLALTEEPVTLFNFRGGNYIGRTKAQSILIDMENAMPIPAVNQPSWWEYESFRKFPPCDEYFLAHFQFWHKHRLRDNSQLRRFAPIWHLPAPIEFYKHYYLVTSKWHLPWQYAVPTPLLYESSRKLIYFKFTLMVLSCYCFGYFHRQKREPVIYLSEDYWVRDMEKMRRAAPNIVSSLPSHSLFTRLLFALRYGPGYSEFLTQLKRELSSPDSELEAVLRRELGV